MKEGRIGSGLKEEENGSPIKGSLHKISYLIQFHLVSHHKTWDLLLEFLGLNQDLFSVFKRDVAHSEGSTQPWSENIR